VIPFSIFLTSAQMYDFARRVYHMAYLERGHSLDWYDYYTQRAIEYQIEAADLSALERLVDKMWG
jgi:hypothetical protein